MSEPGSFLAERSSRKGDENGFSVLELLIVMALLGVILSMVAAGMINMTSVTRSTEDRGFADTELRNAVDELARDIRAANPIDPQSPVSLYDTQISFEVYCSTPGGTCGTNNLRQMVYRVTSNRLEVSVGGGAFTTLLGPRPSSLPLAQRQFAIVNTASEPVFTYLRADGTPLLTAGGAADAPATFKDCTRAVRIHLRMITEPGNTDAPADLTTAVTLRNFNEAECD